MTGALKVFLLLLQGSLCLEWEITMPLRIDGLTGSCVKVPCTFDFDSQFDGDLDHTCKAIWIRGSTGGTFVFDSSLTGDQASGNILQGNLTGNLQNKKCTTIFYNMQPSHSDYYYYFRIQCDHRLKATYPTGVRITTQNSLDQPTITPSTLEVEEGALVTLSCTAVAPCPILPPGLTWTPRIGNIEEKHESESMVSVMNFTSSYLHNGQNFSCTALYKRQAGNTDLRLEKFMTLHVLFPPKETTIIIEPKGPLLEGSSVSLLCNSRANPPVTNYTWYKGDEEEKEAGSSLVLNNVKPSSSGDYYCVAENEHGDQNSTLIRLDIQYLPKNTSVSVDPSGPVQDGSSVTLTCTSIANPAAVNFTWFRAAGREEKVMGSERDLTFNVTKLSEDQYYCEALNVHGPGTSERVSFDVTFPPEILSSSRCIKISSMIRCSCYSQGNPPPSLVWKLAGEPVNHSAAIPIREESLGNVGMKSIITLYDLDEDTLSLVCLSINSLGSDSFAFSLSKIEQGLHSLSFGIGFVVAALGMLLVCVPLLIIYYRKGKVISSSDKGKAETCNPVVTDAINSSKVDVIYANKAFLEEKEVAEEELHYVNVDFAKLQAHSKGKPGEGEISGLDSKTEYAEIRLQSRGSIGGDAEEEENVSDTQLEQEKTPWSHKP
ncbi:myelin-associated glycoprotein-like isoform X1 [Trematomus bernacchii]|uniref:myelin-associated glycoprotein-like isoform X1 n=1 Tax=Trematomus bernacchii TaxID=40690 RepID=UPI00146CECA9|nr:myelin-associated glycoprotein-like isoform X1 [Trematomus bernacchii]